jgi:hypothetical protein
MFRTASSHGNARAFACKRKRDGASDASTAAGNERCFSI